MSGTNRASEVKLDFSYSGGTVQLRDVKLSSAIATPLVSSITYDC